MNLDKNYKGIDADLETSLEEYGFVARPITVDYPDEYFVIYKMGENEYGSGHIRVSELDALVNGTEWASDDDINSMLETVGSSKEEWMSLPFESKFNDLISYWGTENVMGTDYYPNDKKWSFEEIGIDESEEDDTFEINSISELYDWEESSQYPYARDMVAYFIFGDRNDNLIDKAIRGVYSKERADESKLSEIMLGYENNWKENMEQLDVDTVEELGDLMDYYAKGGSVKDNLEKELRKLQKELNSSRLGTYIEGDDSEEAMALRRERESKLTRFNEVLKTLNEIDKDSFANGGGVETRTISYEDGGLAGLVDEEQMRDISFKIKVKTMPKEESIILHEVVEIEEYDAVGEKNVNLPKFHLIYGNNSLAIFDAFGVDEVAGLKREDAVEFIENLKKQGKTEKDGSFMAGLTNFSGDQIFMFFNVERLNFKGFANRVLPHEALHLSRYLISLYKNKWMRENLNTPNWWEDKRATFTELNDDNEEFFAETLERTTAIAMDGWFRATGSRCLADGGDIGLFKDGGETEGRTYAIFSGDKTLSSVYLNDLGYSEKYVGYDDEDADKFGMKQVPAPRKLFVFRDNRWLSFKSKQDAINRIEEWKEDISKDDRYTDKIKNSLIKSAENLKKNIFPINYAKGGSVKSKAEKLFEERISYRWKNTDMGSGWLIKLDSPNDDETLEEELYLDIYDFDEDEYSFEDWKEDMLQTSKESFIDKFKNKYFDDFLEYIQRDKDDYYADGGGVEGTELKYFYVKGRNEDAPNSLKDTYSEFYSEEDLLDYLEKWRKNQKVSFNSITKVSMNGETKNVTNLYLNDYNIFDYADGGGVDGFKRFDVDFYDDVSTNINTSVELIIRADSLNNAIEDAIKKAYELKKNYIEFYHRGFFLGSINFANSNDFKEGKFYNKFISDDLYADGGGVDGDYYAKGGGVGYNVFNYTDNIYATDEVFKTKTLANKFIKEFRNRFANQGYYRDNRMNKINIEDIDLLAIPSDFSPFKKFADGGDIENEFYIFEGIDHYNSIPLFRVESTSDSDAEYVGEWHTDRNDAEMELRELNGDSFNEDIYSNVDEELIRVSAEEIYNEQGFMNFRNLFLKLADTDERSGDIETANFRRALVKEYQEKQPRIK